MKKAYIQPEAELLSLATLVDFLDGSTEGEITTPGNGDDWDDSDPWA